MRDSRDRERSNTQVNYGDYESILSKYRTSITATTTLQSPLESIQEDDHQNFSIDQMEKDTENCQKLRKNNDMDLVNQNELIFQRVLSENDLKNMKVGKNDCCICHKQFGVLNVLKQCKFCGNCICKDHGKKKRKDPQNVGRFRKVCEICDDKYVRLSVERTYIQKRDELAKQTLELDSSSQSITKEIRGMQNKISEMQQNSIKKQGEHKQIQNQLIFKISKLDSEMKNITEEQSKQQSQIKIIEKEIKELDQSVQAKNQDVQKKKQQQLSIEEEIDRADLQCQRVQLEIEKLQLEFQTKRQKDQLQSQSQDKQQKQQQQPEAYQQYLLTQESATIQQYDPYLKEKQQKKEDSQPQEEEKSCCKIM